MIIFDTETTGLPAHASAPLDHQPEILEVAALRLHDETLMEIEALTFLCRPKRFPLPPEITKMNGITDEMVIGQPTFARMLPKLEAFFLGEKTVVAHNAAFDITLLTFELRRLDRVTKFPWPPMQLCTVELNMDILGRRMKQTDLYKHATGKDLVGAHRALVDTRALAEIVRWMRTHQKI